MDIRSVIGRVDEAFTKALRAEELPYESIYRECAGKLTLEELFSFTAVYNSALRCAAGFRRRSDTQNFLKACSLNSYRLKEEVLAGKFRPKYYRQKRIMERGKVRTIVPPTFSAKVVQKLLCDYLVRPLLEPEMIRTSYASIVGRGTGRMYADVLRALNANVKNEDTVIVMTDFKGYFDSIDICLLRKMFAERVADPRVVELIMSFSPNAKGLSLGNEISQIPASFYPTAIDKALKAKLTTHQYFRYMDDILFIALNRKEAEEALENERRMAGELGLTLKEPKVVPMREGFSFCKERYRFDKKKGKYFRLCSKMLFTREKKKLKHFAGEVAKGNMEKEYPPLQYKSVSGALKARPNSQKSRERLEGFYQRCIREGR